MQTTTSIALGTDGTLIYDDVVVNVEWFSGTQSPLFIVAGAYDYINGKQVVCPFAPGLDEAIQNQLMASPEILENLKAEWEQSPEGLERYAA